MHEIDMDVDGVLVRVKNVCFVHCTDYDITFMGVVVLCVTALLAAYEMKGTRNCQQENFRNHAFGVCVPHR